MATSTEYLVKGPENMQEKTDEGTWFAMKVRYHKAADFVKDLPSELGETFVPPVITNLFFIRTDFQFLSTWKRFHELGTSIHFMRDSRSGNPITIRSKDMEFFMKVCAASELPIVMDKKPEIKLGDRVRVKEGPLKGLEGNVVRIRKSRRILVNIGSVLWAATEFISPDLLEVIEPFSAEENGSVN